jgi:hypothetical protein
MLSIFKPSRFDDIDLLKAQLFFVLPAVCAVVFSAWWCSRNPQHWDNVDLAGRITVLSYPIFGVIMGFTAMIQSYFNGGSASFSAVEILLLGASLGVAFAFAGLVVTGLPAFIAEYLVIRFVRRRWSSAVFPGVVQ